MGFARQTASHANVSDLLSFPYFICLPMRRKKLFKSGTILGAITTLEWGGLISCSLDRERKSSPKFFGPKFSCTFLGRDMGGCIWGEENVPENALSRNCCWNPCKSASGLLCGGFLYRKNRALTPEQGGRRTEILPGKSGLFGPDWSFSGPIAAFLGLIGADSSAPHSP